ncbi:hypothetical protein BX616_002001, partial [Lobosporangium transversale]
INISLSPSSSLSGFKELTTKTSFRPPIPPLKTNYLKVSSDYYQDSKISPPRNLLTIIRHCPYLTELVLVVDKLLTAQHLKPLEQNSLSIDSDSNSNSQGKNKNATAVKVAQLAKLLANCLQTD